MTRRKLPPRRVLLNGVHTLGASSATFYVRDPWFPDDLTLAYMPGVRITEPMHGFIFPPSSLERMCLSKPRTAETFFKSAGRSRALRDRDEVPAALPPALRALYANFVDRENVASCARFRHFGEDGRVEAVLWINFDRPQSFGSRQKSRMRRLFRDLAGCVPEATRDVARRYPFPIQRLAPMLDAAGELATARRDKGWYLDRILSAALDAFDIEKGDGHGSVFLHDPETRTLRRTTQRFGGRGWPEAYAPDEGKGILSWVAAKKRAILIPDVGRSAFRDLYHPVDERTVSLLAVPMLAGDELKGVINLESRKARSPFQPDSVRTLWLAASHASITALLSEQTDRTSRLLEIAHEATVEVQKPSAPLADLAKLASTSLRANQCEVWLYSEAKRRFTESGATYGARRSETPPREHGWSEWILAHGKPVWIHGVRSVGKFERRIWDAGKGKWLKSATGADPMPKRLNPRVLELGTRSELGIPVRIEKRWLGALWLKFDVSELPPPNRASMAMALGFAAEAGLVLDVIQHAEEVAQEKVDRRFRTELRERLFRSGPLEGIEGVEGYVHYRTADPDIGGDLFATHHNEGGTCFLVGDAEGHGVRGAMSMLPMLTTFQLSASEALSPRLALRKLLRVCSDWQIRGTAVCFVLERQGDTAELVVSSAGHHPLRIIRKNLEIEEFPPLESKARTTPLGMALPGTTREATASLFPGDTVLAYTDGVLLEEHETPFDVEDLIKVAVRKIKESPRGIAEAIVEASKERAGGEIGDDVTVLVLRVVKANPAGGES